jgi:hypothetical protein
LYTRDEQLILLLKPSIRNRVLSSVSWNNVNMESYLLSQSPLEICFSKGCKYSFVKVKLSLYFFFKLSTTPWRRIGEWRYSYTHSLTSALDGGEWSASRPGRFTPRERAISTHWIGGWVGTRAVLDTVVKRKITSRRRESNPTTPIELSRFCKYFLGVDNSNNSTA